MRFRVRPLAAVKRGNALDEYEDAYWPRRTIARLETRCAVADGATEASFSGIWAWLLVDGYRRGALQSDLTNLTRLQQRWKERVRSRPLPWYAEEKARRGAFSSLLGVTVTGGCWEALAVGDSCLFHVRDAELLCAFPLTRSADLAAAPHLISSLPSHNAILRDHIRRARGTLASGDRLYLATDALAGWFLRRIENGLTWDELDVLRPATFPAWLAARRLGGAIRNDDTTLIGIDVL